RINIAQTRIQRLLLFYTWSMKKETEIRFETASPFVPYIHTLKGVVLRHCLIKTKIHACIVHDFLMFYSSVEFSFM
ncbi:hypothetical protein, partial [Histophilus somni]|uniref:hypothetical protein n=1 Tax=Histophilus somni TaxID=731 RepID=UPI00201F8DF4